MRLVDFYNKRVADLEGDAFLKQVGHTERGEAISDRQLDDMVEDLCALAELSPGDCLLDLCCGNGFLTRRFAEHVERVVGVDFSGAMIEVGTNHNRMDNVTYQVGDAFNPEGIAENAPRPFTKLIMHGALQHFAQHDFERLLAGILEACDDNCVLVFGFVPEHGKQSSFYTTPKSRMKQRLRHLFGRDVMGTWWEKEYIRSVCGKLGLECSFHSVPASLFATNYRFNLRVTRGNTYAVDHDAEPGMNSIR